jgi:cytoskeleton protein RodZ
MKKTGGLLKSARENKNLSLHEIGMSLKINPKILQAIEEGELEKLPPKTFLRGFVKSYAQFLKLDPKTLLDSFDRETNPLIDQASETLASEPEPSFMETKKQISPTTSSKLSERAPSHIDRSGAAKTQRTLMMIGGIVLVAVIVIVARLVNKYQKERGQVSPRAEIAQSTEAIPPKPTEGEVLPKDPSAAPEGAVAAPALDQWATSLLATPPNQTAAPNSAAPPPSTPPATPPPEVPKPTTPVAAIPAPAPAPTPVVAAAPPPVKEVEQPKPVEEKPIKPQKPASETKTEAPAPVVAKADEEVAATPHVKSQEVIIEASGKVQISYSLGGGTKQSVELNADDVHTFKSKSSISLDISDGAAVSLIVNGYEKGKPGKAGEPVHLSYPK